jgi:hypothetical protein
MNEDLRLHREAEVLMGYADLAKAQGRPQEAATLRCQAAELEAQVFGLLPLDRPKTRGITAVSSVALYRKAGALDRAICQAEIFLKHGGMHEFSRLDLEEMVEEMRAELEATASVERLAP